MEYLTNNKGMTLIEVTIAGAMMALLGLASMKLAENNAKTQKKMNFSTQMNQLDFQMNLQLRKSGSCFNTLEQNQNMTEHKYSGGVDTETSDCATQGDQLDNIYNNRGDVFITKGETYGTGSGAAYTVNDIRIIKPSILRLDNGNEINDDGNQVGQGNATICVQLQLVGTQTYGRRSIWLTETFQFTGISNAGEKTITSCSAEQIANIEDACKALGGTLNDKGACRRLNVGQADDFTPDNLNDFQDKNITDAAINALGNMGIGDNLHVCGDITVGNKTSGSFPSGGDMSGCQPSTVFASNLIADSIGAKSAAFRDLSVSGNLTLTGNINGRNINAQGDLAVLGKSVFTGNAKFEGPIKSSGIDNGTKNLRTGSIYVDEKSILPGKDGSLMINSKIRGLNHENGNMDYLVTLDWVNNWLVSKMSDDDINSFLNALFTTINNDEQWSSENTVQTITNFVQKKLTLTNNNNDDGNLLGYMTGAALASKQAAGDFDAGQEYCSPGYSVAHVEIDSTDDPGTLPAKLKYYCRSNADTGGDKKYFVRVVGDELTKFMYSQVAGMQDCNIDTDEISIGAYCFKRVQFCKMNDTATTNICKNNFYYDGDDTYYGGTAAGQAGGWNLPLPTGGSFSWSWTGTHCPVIKKSSLLQSDSDIYVLPSESSQFGTGAATSFGTEGDERYQYPKNGQSIVVMSSVGIPFLAAGALGSINQSTAKTADAKNAGPHDFHKNLSSLSLCTFNIQNLFDIAIPRSSYLKNLYDLVIPQSNASATFTVEPGFDPLSRLNNYWNPFAIYQRIK